MAMRCNALQCVCVSAVPARLLTAWAALTSVLGWHDLCAGGGVAEARHQALTTLVHRCRRFFPPGSAAEIWATFEPALADPQRPEAFEVSGGHTAAGM